MGVALVARGRRMRHSRNRTRTSSPAGPRLDQEPVIATAAPARDRVPESGTVTRGLRRMPALDGLRALAVVAVLLYHADVSFVPGGFLGVDVFFVLSGFLITALLLRELGRRGRIGFGAFYLGRARRLLPALFVLLLVVALAAAFVVRDAASTVRTDLLAAVGYVANWWFVVKESSYFEGLGPPPMLQHLLVAVGGGAVLPALAGGRPAGLPLAAGARRAHRGRRRSAGLDAAHGLAVGTRRVPGPQRPEPGLLRHRHACHGAARWCCAGLRVADLAAGRRAAD